MASSNLKLIIQKGPRSGDTLEYNSKSTIRIGRLVKGNNLTIKDSGISSKHLEIKFNSDSLSWVIKDLDSCNGTIVNTSQLKPLSQSEIYHGDEIKIGEFTSIRAEIVEIKQEINIRRNPRRQVSSQSCNDLKGKVEEGLNLGDNVEIKEEIGNHRKSRRRAASRICTNLGGKVEEGSNEEENVEIREEINDRRNPKKQAASKRGHDLENKVGVPEDGCLNLEEEIMEKGVKGNRREHGKGRPKKVSNLDDVSADDEFLGVRENVGNVPMKSECGVSTRRTRSSKRVGDGLVSLVEAMPARRTRTAKKVEEVGTSFVIEKVVESTGSDPDKCKEVENTSIVDDKKTRRGRGRKKKVGAESLEAIADAAAEEKMNHVVLEKEHTEKMVDLREQPWDEPVDDPPEQNVDDDMKNKHLMEVEVSEQEGDALSMSAKHCAELMDETDHVTAECLENVRDVAKDKMNDEVFEKVVDLGEQPCDEPVDGAPGKSVLDDTKNQEFMDVEIPEQGGGALSMREKQIAELMDEGNQQHDRVSLPVSGQHFAELMDGTNQQGNCVSVSMSEQHCEELIDEPTQREDCVVGPSLVEVGVCDGVGSDAVFDNGRKEESEIVKESEANCYGRCKDPGTANVADLENMTLLDWFDFLQTYFPKQIHAATDEIVKDMQKRSVQFDEYMLQQQKEK